MNTTDDKSVSVSVTAGNVDSELTTTAVHNLLWMFFTLYGLTASHDLKEIADDEFIYHVKMAVRLGAFADDDLLKIYFEEVEKTKTDMEEKNG